MHHGWSSKRRLDDNAEQNTATNAIKLSLSSLIPSLMGLPAATGNMRSCITDQDLPFDAVACSPALQVAAAADNKMLTATSSDHDLGQELINDEQHQDGTLHVWSAIPMQPTTEHCCQDAYESNTAADAKIHSATPSNTSGEQGQEGRKTKVKTLLLAALRPRRAQTMTQMLPQLPMQTLPT